MTDDFGTPITPVAEPKKKNTTLIIVIVVLLIILCCCCAAGILAWNFGDQIWYELQSLMGF
ncbi:MAG: hypothetical protein JW726_11045 [Anaerolineales bacterium]|nr:hypothetical protein [Anaerolineales bacterium]